MRVIAFCGLLAPAMAVAAPVPQLETETEAVQRIEAGRAAKKDTEILGTKGFWSSMANLPTVVTVTGTGGEPWTDAIRRAHTLFAVKKLSSGTQDYILNLDLPGMITGVQFLKKGAPSTAVAQQPAEAWLDGNFAFNGASEDGLIGMTRWCRRGGAYQMPRACATLSAKAKERLVWDKTAQ